MRRFLTLAACVLVLWAIVSQLNHALTGVRVYLFVGALFVTFAAITQRLGTGLIVTVFAGLVYDANTPVAFGTHAVLFAATHLAVYRLRDRIPRNDTASRVALAVVANLALFLVFSFVQIVREPALAAMWPRLFIDLLCSQIFLALIAPWYFALQARGLVLMGVENVQFA